MDSFTVRVDGPNALHAQHITVIAVIDWNKRRAYFLVYITPQTTQLLYLYRPSTPLHLTSFSRPSILAIGTGEARPARWALLSLRTRGSSPAGLSPPLPISSSPFLCSPTVLRETVGPGCSDWLVWAVGHAWSRLARCRDLWSHSVSELDAVGEVNVGSRQNRQI